MKHVVNMVIISGILLGSLAQAAEMRSADAHNRTEMQAKVSGAIVDADDDVCWVAPEWRAED
jgi:hypothetical protein